MRSHRFRSLFYLVAILTMVLTCLPAQAQEAPAGAWGGPTPASGGGVPQAPDAATLAKLPDRTQFKLLETTAKGDSVQQTAQFPVTATYIASGFPDTNLNSEPTMSIG